MKRALFNISIDLRFALSQIINSGSYPTAPVELIRDAINRLDNIILSDTLQRPLPQLSTPMEEDKC